MKILHYVRVGVTALLMFIGIGSPQPALADAASGLTYAVDAAGNAVITGCAEACLNHWLVIPSTLDGHVVTGVGTGAFRDQGLISVVIPSSVRHVDDFAFLSNQLLSVVLPDALSSIGRAAFESNQLLSVVLPDSLTNVSACAFCDNQLTSIELPSSLTRIGDSGFSNNRLTSVVIPASVTSIARNAFADNRLVSVKFLGDAPKANAPVFLRNPALTRLDVSRASLGWYSVWNRVAVPAFSDVPSPPLGFQYSVGADGGVTINGCDDLCPSSSLVIPETLDGHLVTRIGEGAFYGLELTSVELPSSLTSIGACAFCGNQLTSIELPSSLTRIGDSGFSNNRLTSVVIPASVTSINDYAFADNCLTLATFLGDAPVGTENVFESNTWGCARTNVSVHRAVAINADSKGWVKYWGRWPVAQLATTSAGDFLFTVDGESNATIIGCATACASTDLVIPSTVLGHSVVSIGESAFQENQLTSIVIPASVVRIDGQAFAFNSLNSVKFLGDAPKSGSSLFYSNPWLTSVDVDRAAHGWFARWQGLTVPAFADSPAPLVFRYTLASDGNVTINGCEDLCPSLSIVIPEMLDGHTVTGIGDWAFGGSQLTSIVIPGTVTSIGNYAFYGNKLTSFMIPAAVTSIGDAAFYWNQLTSVVLPDSLASIGQEAFLANKLTSIVIPAAVTSIGSQAFSSNPLAQLRFLGKERQFASSMFDDNGTITHIEVDSAQRSGWGATWYGWRIAVFNPKVATKPETPLLGGFNVHDHVVDIAILSPSGSAAESITGYQYSMNRGAWTNCRMVGNTCQIWLYSAGIKYGVQLRAVNVLGVSSPTPTNDAKWVTVSEPPIITSVTPAIRAFNVFFTPPYNTGGYKVSAYQYSVDGGQTWTTWSGKSTSSTIKIVGLANGTSYPVQIRAVTALGPGKTSNPIGAITPVDVPAVPYITSVLAGKTSITVNFAPPTSNGGSSITNFAYMVDGKTWVTASPASAGTPLVISGVASNKTYTVKIRAINRAGSGAISAARTIKTLK